MGMLRLLPKKIKANQLTDLMAHGY